MLQKFLISNYKNFKGDLFIDLTKISGYQFNLDCIYRGTISKMLIYGRNATGKTNLGLAINDIKEMMDEGLSMDTDILNADADEEEVRYEYTFSFDNRELIYQYSKSSEGMLLKEKLFIDTICIYDFDFHEMLYDYKNLIFIEADGINIDRYLDGQIKEEYEGEVFNLRIPFLKWLIGNVVFDKESIINKLASFITRMDFITVGTGTGYRRRRWLNYFYKTLDSKDGVQKFETFLNAMGVKCRLKMEKTPDDQLELYLVYGKKLIPFYENISSGTKALMELYRQLFSQVISPSLIYLDEFDAFYHYEMAERVVCYFKNKYPSCQLIFTTHNTNLMTNRLVRPDCVFILSEKGTLTSLCNATTRELREGHNLEKMYISGEFKHYE